MTETIESEVEVSAEQTPNGESAENSGEENQTSSQNSSTGRYKKGDKLRFVRVRFPGNAKSFPFMIGDRYFQYGQKVIAPSDRGMALGYINSFPYEVEFDESMLPLKYINKIATEEDIAEDQSYVDKQKEAEVIALELIEKFQLDMNLTHVEFTQFGKKAVFYFTAPNRVDFRSLVKELVSRLKTRIELRQISVRDRAASIGGIGSCGRQLCCSSFLQKYGNATIKMAKNQNMMLAGSKINGVCGQLKCCIQYEDEVYTYKRKRLPKEGSFIKVKNGDCGKVLRLEILAENFTMLTDQGVKKRYHVDQYNPQRYKLPDNYSFPERFDHISDETSLLIKEQDESNKISEGAVLQALKEQAQQTDEEKASTEERKENSPQQPPAEKRVEESEQKSRRSNNRRRRPRNGNRRPRSKNGEQAVGNSPRKNKKRGSSNTKERKNGKEKKDFVYKRRDS